MRLCMHAMATTNHSYRSPLLGAHDYPNRHKTQVETISKTSYGSLPYQRELATYTESSAVADTIKLEGHTEHQNSMTKNAHSAPSDKVPSTLFYGPGSTRAPPVVKTPKELARDYRYISNVFVAPGPRAGADDHSIHKLGYTPFPEECKQTHSHSMQASSLGNEVFGFNEKSEYAKSYPRPKADDVDVAQLKKRDSKSFYCCPIGPAKLNVTHNIITGDRYNRGERKIGRSCNSDTYCTHPLFSQNDPSHRSQIAQRNLSSSIPQGDPAREFQDKSCNQASYQDSLPKWRNLRFDTLADTASRTFKTSIDLHENKKRDASAYTTLSQTDYYKHDCKPATRSKCWWLDKIPKGDMDPVRVGERIDYTTAKMNYVKPSVGSYSQHVGKVGHVTDSSIHLGSHATDTFSCVSTNSSAYAPYAEQSRQHIVPPPKDKLSLKFHDDDYVQSTNMTESYKSSMDRPVPQSARMLKIKNALDYMSHWSLPSMGSPCYTTTHKAHYSNPMPPVEH